MRSDDHYDYIIIGSGAGGGTLALKAPSGKRILILERGDYPTREAELGSDRSVREELVRVEGRVVGLGRQAVPAGIHYFVGGATKMFGAAMFRLRRQDFTAHRTADGSMPTGQFGTGARTVYTQAESLPRPRPARRRPHRSTASAPYAFPPVSHEPRVQQIADGLKRVGYRPAYAPTGIMLDEADHPHSRCIRCNSCDGYPCLVHAKADEVIAVTPALQYPNVRLQRNAHVQRLETDAVGRAVTNVIVDPTASTRSTPAASSSYPAEPPIPHGCF